MSISFFILQTKGSYSDIHRGTGHLQTPQVRAGDLTCRRLSRDPGGRVPSRVQRWPLELVGWISLAKICHVHRLWSHFNVGQLLNKRYDFLFFFLNISFSFFFFNVVFYLWILLFLCLFIVEHLLYFVNIFIANWIDDLLMYVWLYNVNCFVFILTR